MTHREIQSARRPCERPLAESPTPSGCEIRFAELQFRDNANLLIFPVTEQTEGASADNRRACRSTVRLTQKLRIRTRNSCLLCGPGAHDQANWNVRLGISGAGRRGEMERSQVRAGVFPIAPKPAQTGAARARAHGGDARA